ncbi:MAG: malonyl CoA-acyl carrier protein transacylase [bacterium]|nr:MAG: malonyl CoA-acyl carrier protein transacylase [bacterium]
MGEDLYKKYSFVRELFQKASDNLGTDFAELCFKGPLDVLTRTDNVQPAVTLINAVCYEVLQDSGIKPSAAAGHSLGEYSALYAAGVMEFTTLMSLVSSRGRFMQEAAEKNPGGMLAVMGLEIEKIKQLCEDVRENGSVEIANINSPGQVILSGEKQALDEVRVLAKKEKAKLVVPLKVSGPWHSKFMVAAQKRMAAVIDDHPFKEASIPVMANVTAEYESSPGQIKTNLISQITSPVLWSDSITKLINDGYTKFVETGPKKVLRGIMKGISKKVEILNVEDADSLRNMREVLAANFLSSQ